MCDSKKRKLAYANQMFVKRLISIRKITCFHCGKKEHSARGCRKPPEVKTEYNGNRELLGNKRGLMESTCHHAASTQ
jgi:hypothetical protein